MSDKDKKDKDQDSAAEDKATKPKKTLTAKKTLSLKASVGNKVRQNIVQTKSSSPGVSVEVRRSRRSGAAVKPASSRSSKKTDSDDLSLTSGEREARAEALKRARDSQQSRTSLPDLTIIGKRREGLASAVDAEEDNDTDVAPDLAAAGPAPEKKPGSTRQHTSKAEEESYRERLKAAEDKKTPPKRDMRDRRGAGRITVTQALNRDYERDRGPSLAAQRRAREKARMAAKGPKEALAKVVREVVVPEAITVQELSNRMAEPAGSVVKALMKLGVMATITQTIDADTAELLIEEFGHKIKRVTEADVEIGLDGEEDNPKDLVARPPVVTIMGHVDHGKTSLLDALRETDVVSGEAGGITQHIGAYQVKLSSGDKITFLDTPGHAAFTEMRARGANVTDIVVIVVSAADSVMPQTVEAINHAKAAKVPIIIAVNKIDLEDANPMKVKQELLQHEIVVEDMGGDILCIEISALKKTNLDKLEEAILLQAEMLELKANPERAAQGAVVESKLEKGRGAVGTVLIQKGTLRIGDIIVAGAEYGKVKALINDKGKNVDEAIPGEPVEVLGLNGVPEAGDVMNVVLDEAKAREVTSYRQRQRKKAQAAQAIMGRTTIEQLLEQREKGETTTLPVLIKADVHGSVEAIVGSLDKLVEENEGIAVQVLHTGVGGITESDVTLARASGAMIIGFNVRANAQARALAQQENADMRYYNVIYNVIDDVKAVLSGMLSPTEREEYLGQAKILQVFNITKVGKVAGCMVTTGTVKRGAKVRLLRDDVVIHEGTLKTLKRFQDEVKEVKEGTECGMAFETYDDIKADDVIECYEVIEEARTVS